MGSSVPVCVGLDFLPLHAFGPGYGRTYTTDSLSLFPPATRVFPPLPRCAQGYALTCCSYAQSDVVVKCIPEDELIDQQFAR